MLHALLELGAWLRAAWVLDLVLRTVCSSCSSVSLSAALASGLLGLGLGGKG